jgi:NADPH:quinone reductase-like Zn-dependent oxidoreductase
VIGTMMQVAELHAAGSAPRSGERPVPECGSGEILIRVLAAPITPLDRLCAGGTSYFGVPATPYVPGVQGVGTVEAGGELPAGSPVWFATSAGMKPGDGSMRVYASVPHTDVVPLPSGADPVLVAALGLSAVAAWMAMTLVGELAAGEQVLVMGAGGVVGQAAVQLARTAGARRVVAAARSARALERASELGADTVVSLAAGDDVEELATRLREACDGPVDLVLDPLFGVPAAAALRTLRPGGRLVNLGSSAAETAPVDSSTLRSRSLRILGYTNNALTVEQRADALTHIVEQVVAGRLRVEHQPVPLTAVGNVWDNTARGRVVLVP